MQAAVSVEKPLVQVGEPPFEGWEQRRALDRVLGPHVAEQDDHDSQLPQEASEANFALAFFYLT